MLKLDFIGKNVLVVGGGRGIGKACALNYADCGANIFIGNRNEEQGKSTVEEIKKMGARAGFCRADISKKEDAAALLDAALEFFGGTVDVILHNAGVISTYDFLVIEPEEVERLFNINVLGVSHMLQEGMKQMIKQGHGNIVTISSIAGRTNMGLLQHYCATKAAVISLTQAAAKKGAPHGIRVNSGAPGIIRTNMWEEILDGMATGWQGTEGGRTAITPEERERNWNNSIKDLIPMGQAQTEDDIAYGVLFISSDLAKTITGQVLTIDGGCTMV